MPRRDVLGIEPYDSGYDSLASFEAAHPYPSDPRALAVPCPLISADAPRVLVCHDCSGRPPTTAAERRYTFEWLHLVTDYVHFSHRRVTIPPPEQIIAAHRNGARCLGVLIFEGDLGASDCIDLVLKPPSAAPSISLFRMRSGPRGSPFDHVDVRIVDRLVELALGRGFDGYLLNFEVALGLRDPSMTDEDGRPKRRFAREHAAAIIAWIECLRAEVAKRVPRGTVVWYDSVTTLGDLRWQCRLTPLNAPLFLASDSIFLDYHWHPEWLDDLTDLVPRLDRAGRRALADGTEVRHTPADVFVGIDIYGRGMIGGGGFDTHVALAAVPTSLSVALFAPAWTRDELSRPRQEAWSTWQADDAYFWVGAEVAPASVARERARRDEEAERRRREKGETEPDVPPFRPVIEFLPTKRHSETRAFSTSFSRGGSDGPFRIEGDDAIPGPWTDVGVTTSCADRLGPATKGISIVSSHSWIAGHALEIDPRNVETRWLPLCSTNIPLAPSSRHAATIVWHSEVRSTLPPRLLLELTAPNGKVTVRAVNGTTVSPDAFFSPESGERILHWRHCGYEFTESSGRITGRVTAVGVQLDPALRDVVRIGFLALQPRSDTILRFVEQPTLTDEGAELVIRWQLSATPLWCAIEAGDGCLGTTHHPARFVAPRATLSVDTSRVRIAAVAADGSVIKSKWAARPSAMHQ